MMLAAMESLRQKKFGFDFRSNGRKDGAVPENVCHVQRRTSAFHVDQSKTTIVTWDTHVSEKTSLSISHTLRQPLTESCMKSTVANKSAKKGGRQKLIIPSDGHLSERPLGII